MCQLRAAPAHAGNRHTYCFRGNGLTQPGEGAHDVDAHLHGSLAVKHGGGHEGAVLSEGNRRIFAVGPAACV